MDSSSSTPPEPGDAEQRPQFTFVLGQSQQGVRSHAMREYWKQRHHKQSAQRRKSASHTTSHRPLLPNLARQHQHSNSASGPIPEQPTMGFAAASTSASTSTPTSEPGPILTAAAAPESTPHSPFDAANFRLDDQATVSSQSPGSAWMDGIPSQIMSGLNHAIACSRLDPFDMFPVKLTAQHHKLLHHWLSTYATMMFEQLPAATFNPMRDVWFPLDLSNAASFNAVMAHSAAHLAGLRGIKASKEALKFKSEAVRIVRQWMSDPILSLSDDVFAAVLRLLTYERYWGTESEWRLHRDGLERMMEVRGGISALQKNWRLELVIFLVSLMSKPSWFDTSNNLWEIAQQPLEGDSHPIRGNSESMYRVRCLWLISFIQDLRTFTKMSPTGFFNGLGRYSNVHDAVILLQNDMQLQLRNPKYNGQYNHVEFCRLSSLFLISVLLQESVSTNHTTPLYEPLDYAASPILTDLALVDIFLDSSRDSWQHSVEVLHTALFENSESLPDGSQKTEYVLHMTNVLASMSSEARRGVERCLLHILRQTEDDCHDAFLDDDWDPDSLLSSSHGL